jgi:hypothetical protein
VVFEFVTVARRRLLGEAWGLMGVVFELNGMCSRLCIQVSAAATTGRSLGLMGVGIGIRYVR